MNNERKVVPPRKGLLHLMDAAGYSLQGLRRLLRESAARQEVAAGLLGTAALGIRGASVGQILTFGMLVLALLAVEALNTALEEVVDHLSPGWSEMARNAKDLGSLAVGLVAVILAAQFGWAMLCPA
ncbi:MAG: diacylglycerol kinase [Gemmobacter sp.]|uniref:diacylglycerol kinase n=1 Tax=Gemmobacter sp. TaxID=1898957 RepID=UPI001A588614|nr:diacylglycerol kinase [Gemmobacter sp.]MBL8561696.1 diacylglycerol kinase [Gemmobacter sp.]